MVILNGAPTKDYEKVKADLTPFILKTVMVGLAKHQHLNIDPNEIIEYAYIQLLSIVRTDKTYRIDKTMKYLKLDILDETRKVVRRYKSNVPFSDEVLNPATQRPIEEMVFLMLVADEVRSTMGECNYADLLIDY